VLQAIGIALESHRLDIIERLYEKTNDSGLLAYSMEAVLDNHFPLSYRDQVLNFLYPLFPPPTIDSKSPHIHSLTRLLVTLSNPALTVTLLVSLVPGEKLVAYQLAFDLVEGGAQDFLETVRNDLPVEDEVRLSIRWGGPCSKHDETRSQALYLKHFARFWVDASL
jgi:26S proteasome regulatory subunit N2